MEFKWPHFDWREDFQPGQLRVTVNEHPGVFGLAIGAVFLVIFLCYYLPSRPPGKVVKPAANAYYADEETGQEFVQSATLVPPLPGANGSATLVRAIFFTADGGKTRSAGFYEKFTPEAKALVETLTREEQARRWKEIDAGHLVRSPAPGSPWVRFHSNEATPLVHPTSPDGKQLFVCEPP